MKTLRIQNLFLVGVILWAGLIQTALSAGRFDSLCQEAPIIVRAKILKLNPGTSISDNSKEFLIEAEIFSVAKGNLKKGDRIDIVIKLPVRDSVLLNDDSFGMSEGGNFILFLQPRFSADKKTLQHYRFTETPLGCLPHDFYTWRRIERAIEKR